RKIFLFFVPAFLVSCNVFNPFYSKNTPEDLIEDALRCLHKGDFDCSIDNYLALPDGNLKSTRLCTAYLARAGLTLRTYLDVVTVESATMLGTAADSFLPWNLQKQSDAEQAKIHCAAITGKLGALLNTVALIVHCAMSVAKTDAVVGSSISDMVCTTAGNGSGKITKKDIVNDSSVMCSTDVLGCRNDFVDQAFARLEQEGLGELKRVYDTLPAELKNSQATVATILTAIYSAVPSD
ncbi:MAG: hypothetical protein HY537_08355, partial [Deltaproteobacteria bacterium]|nr:hypothetical protein [Deltaproteobacteria bacterium]